MCRVSLTLVVLCHDCSYKALICESWCYVYSVCNNLSYVSAENGFGLRHCISGSGYKCSRQGQSHDLVQCL